MCLPQLLLLYGDENCSCQHPAGNPREADHQGESSSYFVEALVIKLLLIYSYLEKNHKDISVPSVQCEWLILKISIHRDIKNRCYKVFYILELGNKIHHSHYFLMKHLMWNSGIVLHSSEDFWNLQLHIKVDCDTHLNCSPHQGKTGCI